MLDGGRLIESGSHAELLAKGGAYSHLYKLGFKNSDTPAA
jgi:subfamily B ATP-binding cassette protein MsbA